MVFLLCPILICGGGKSNLIQGEKKIIVSIVMIFYVGVCLFIEGGSILCVIMWLAFIIVCVFIYGVTEFVDGGAHSHLQQVTVPHDMQSTKCQTFLLFVTISHTNCNKKQKTNKNVLLARGKSWCMFCLKHFSQMPEFARFVYAHHSILLFSWPHQQTSSSVMFQWYVPAFLCACLIQVANISCLIEQTVCQCI